MLNLLRTMKRCLEDEFQRMPSLILLLPLVLGIFVSEYLPSNTWMLCITFMVTALWIMLLLYNRRSETALKVMPYFVVASFFLFGVAYMQARSGLLVRESGKCSCVGYVDKIVRDVDGRRNVVVYADSLHVNSLLYRDVYGYVSLYDSDCVLLPGDVFDFSGFVAELDDGSSILYRQRCSFLAFAYDVTQHDEQVVNFSTLFSLFRESIGDRLVSFGVSPSNAGLVSALLVGDRSRLNKRTSQLFSDCGIVHLLAVSGLHVGIVYGLLMLVVRVGRVGNRWGAIFVVLSLVWGYAILCGLSPSVTRASLMLSLYELSKLTGYKARACNVLAVSALLILLIDPLSIYSIGFWLSFAAVWGIVSFVPMISRLFPRWLTQVNGDVWVCGGEWLGMSPFRSVDVWKARVLWSLKRILDACVVSVVAQISTAPFSLLIFRRFPTYFLVNNILFVALVAPVLLLSSLTLVLGGYLPLGGILDGVVSFLVDIAGCTSVWPMCVIDNVCWMWPEALLAMLSLYLLSRWRYGCIVKSVDLARACLASFTLFLSWWFVHIAWN